MFRKTSLAAGFAALVRHRRARGGVRRRSEAARHHAHARRRGKGRQQGRHDSRVHRRAARRRPLQGGQRHPPRPFASEKPRLVIDRQGHAAQHADKLTEGTKELLKRYPDDARRRLSDASHGRAAARGARQHREERRPARRPSTAASASRTCWPAIRSRSRRPATRRCGTTCCATPAWLRHPSTRTGTSTLPACRRWRDRGTLTRRVRCSTRRTPGRRSEGSVLLRSRSTTSDRPAAPAKR